MFPFKLKYSVDIKTSSKEAILLKAQEWLRSNKIHDFYPAADRIIFRISFFGWSWDKFGVLDSGHFLVENSRLNFEASTYRIFFLTLVISFLIGMKLGWIFGVLIFIFSFFGNLLIASYQVKNALKDIKSYF